MAALVDHLSPNEKQVINKLTEEVVEKRRSFPFRQQVESLRPEAAKAALQDFRSYLRQASKKGDQSTTAWSLLGIGMVLSGQRQYPLALKEFEKASQLFTLLSDDYGLGCVYREFSIANRELDRNALALEYSYRALMIFEAMSAPLELAWTYDSMSVTFFNMGRRPESLSFAQKAHGLFADNRDSIALAWNACNLGNINFEMGFFREAEKYYQEAMDTFQSVGNKQGHGWSLLCMGLMSREEARYPEAEKYIEKAKKEFESLGLHDRVGWCWLNLAGVKWSMGEISDAEAYNTKAVRLFTPLNNKDGVAWTLFQLARVLRDRGQLKRSWQTMRESMEFFEHVGNPKGIGWAQLGLAEIYLALGDFNHARESFVKAKVKAEQMDTVPLKSSVEVQLAHFYIDQGMLQKGFGCLKDAEGICKKINNIETYAHVLLERARYAMIVRNLSLARASLDEVEKIVEENHLERLVPMLHVFLGEMAVIEKRYGEAEKFFSEAVKEAEKRGIRFPAALAYLGQIQLAAMKNQQTTSLVRMVEKELRIISSKVLKSKFLMVRAFLKSNSGKSPDIGVANEALKILNEGGYLLLSLQYLNFLQTLCEKNNLEIQAETYRVEKESIISNSGQDLQLAHPRTELFESLPISLVS